MANTERLTKRVKKMEDWVKENEDMGGPAGTLETFNFLVSEARMSSMRSQQTDQRFQQLRAMTFEFIRENDLTEDWDKFVQEKEENAVQEQQTEEIPAQEEAEDSEETIEAPKEDSSEAKD